jgi:hypothetical protein
MDRQLIRRQLSKLPPGSTVIHGGAHGADMLAGQEAARRGLHVIAMPADWTRFGRTAGPIRNQQMLRLLRGLTTSDDERGVWAFHRNISRSRGTADMVHIAAKAGVQVQVFGDADAGSEDPY